MFSILGKKEAVGERCPKCSKVNVEFVDLGLGLLGCLDCRTVFMTKVTVVEAKRNRKPSVAVVSGTGQNAKAIAEYVKKMNDRKVEFVQTKTEPVLGAVSLAPVDLKVETPAALDTRESCFACEICGKVCKTALALSGHKRSHKEAVAA